jgi:hypothetical protein
MDRESLETSRDYWQQRSDYYIRQARLSRAISVGGGILEAAGVYTATLGHEHLPGVLFAAVGAIIFIGFNKVTASLNNNALNTELNAVIRQDQLDQSD